MNRFYQLLLLAVVLGFLVKFFVIETFTVPTDSMTPTIAVGSRVWLLKLPFRPQRGTVVAFAKEGENFIKRIIALPHDSVWLHAQGANRYEVWRQQIPLDAPNLTLCLIPQSGDTIELNASNMPLYQPLIAAEGNQIGFLLNQLFINAVQTNRYVFKKNYYFVQGDNTANSIDSRSFGLICKTQLIGKWLF